MTATQAAVEERKLPYLTLRVLMEGFGIVMKSLLQGVGGLQPLLRFVNQTNLPELNPLSQVMAVNLLKFNSALRQTSTVTLSKKTLEHQETEAFMFLGEEALVSTIEKLADMEKPSRPEIVIMYKAYDYQAESFIAAYKAIRIIMNYLAREQRIERYEVSDPEFLHYLELLRVGRMKGELRSSREERELLCFLVYGNLAEIPCERAEEVIRRGNNAIRYGYLSEILEPSYFDLFETAEGEYLQTFTKVLAEIVPRVISMVEFGKVSMVYSVPSRDKPYWYPALIVPDRSCWQSGKLLGEVILEPLPQLPVFTRQDAGSINAIFGQPGVGKTFWLNSLASFSIIDKGYITFIPLSDDSNQPILSCMPLFPYNERTQKMLYKLNELQKLRAQGLPTLILNVIRPEDRFLLEDECLTIYDRIIEVQDPKTFELDLSIVINELAKVAQSYGYSRPSGLVAVRNFGRLKGKENIDLQICYNLIYKLMDHAERHREYNFRLQFDEISELAPSQFKLAGSDVYALGGMIASLLRRCRRKRISIDFCSQRTVEVLTELRDMSTNIWWRELGEEQLDILFQQSIQIYDEDLKQIIRDINGKGSLRRTYLWNYYNRDTRSFYLMESSIPPHMTQDVRSPHRELFESYEKATGKKLLVPLEQVPTIFKEEKRPRSRPAKRKTTAGAEEGASDVFEGQ